MKKIKQFLYGFLKWSLWINCIINNMFVKNASHSSLPQTLCITISGNRIQKPAFLISYQCSSAALRVWAREGIPQANPLLQLVLIYLFDLLPQLPLTLYNTTHLTPMLFLFLDYSRYEKGKWKGPMGQLRSSSFWVVFLSTKETKVPFCHVLSDVPGNPPGE